MTLRRKFLIFAFLLHVIFLGLSLLLYAQSKYLFAAAEVLIIISIVISAQLYRAFLRPLNLLSAGIDSIKDQDFSSKFTKTGQTELDRLIEVYNRMIDQLRQERVRQREQQFFLQRLIDATPLGVIILDFDDNVEMLNPAAATMLETSGGELLSQPLTQLSGALVQVLQELMPGETRVVNVSGTQTYRCRKSHFLDRGFHHHFILIEELTREILNAQKRAYDKVIRMMSHEINNSVGAVNSILQSVCNYKTELGAETRDEFESSLNVAIVRNTRLNLFMTKLADVVRVPPPSRERYDLHQLLRSVNTLCAVDCAQHRIEWHWRLHSKPLFVNIDVQQLEQVLLNVLKNAIEAIGDDGNIYVTTSSNGDARLSICDDGKGIAEIARPHLFTPFYSTKRDGQGVGLTLIREILLNHGFSFNLEPLATGGAEFWVRFAENHSPRL